MKLLGHIDNIIEKFSSYLLVISVMAMLILTLISIVLRWFDLAIIWIEPFVRHVVFLSAFLGGTLATGKGNHIGIDILSKYLEAKKLEHIQRYIKALINLVCAGALLWLFMASLDAVNLEFKFGKAAFLEIHTGYLVSIIPFGLSLMIYRFAYRFILGLVGEKA